VKKTIVATLAVMTSASAMAFDVDGFRSGMSYQALASVVQEQGWSLYPLAAIPGVYGEYRLGADGKPTGDVNHLGPASFALCQGRLVSYSRGIGPDSEYADTLRGLLANYGSNPHLSVIQQKWAGQGGGYITVVTTRWDRNGDRVELTLDPEGRAPDGSLKNASGAGLSYVHVDPACHA